MDWQIDKIASRTDSDNVSGNGVVVLAIGDNSNDSDTSVNGDSDRMMTEIETRITFLCFH